MITSRQNPNIKAIRQLASRKGRGQSGHFFVEGIRLVAEAVKLDAKIVNLLVAPDLLTSRFAENVLIEAAAAGIDRIDVTPDVFLHISGKDGPQGLAAVIRQGLHGLEETEPGDSLGWVVLERVQNPGNLGTIIRTSDAVGCGGVILIGEATDPYDPSAVRGSMGALFSQRLIRATLEEFTEWVRVNELTVVGAADTGATDYTEYAYRRPAVLCMGNEQHGLSEEHKAICDVLVRVPMVGRSDSLNLSVATGVILYEIYNQARRP